MRNLTIRDAAPRALPSLMILAAALGLLAVSARAIAAQSADEQAAYVALIYTPIGGLPPLPPVSDSSRRANGSGVSLLGRLGHMSRGQGTLTLTSYGAGVEVPHGRTRIGATLAYMSASCGPEWAGDSDCSGDIMVGGSIRTLITSRPLGEQEAPRKGRRSSSGGSDGTLLVGFEGAVGYSPRQGETAMALAASLPTALALKSGTVRILPFISPGVGYGRLSNVQFEDDEIPTSHGAISLMIGGGVGLQFGTSGIGANVGFQRILKGYGGTTQLGIGMTWQGMTSVR